MSPEWGVVISAVCLSSLRVWHQGVAKDPVSASDVLSEKHVLAWLVFTITDTIYLMSNSTVTLGGDCWCKQIRHVYDTEVVSWFPLPCFSSSWISNSLFFAMWVISVLDRRSSLLRHWRSTKADANFSKSDSTEATKCTDRTICAGLVVNSVLSEATFTINWFHVDTELQLWPITTGEWWYHCYAEQQSYVVIRYWPRVL